MCANDRLGVVLLAGGAPARGQVRADRGLLGAGLLRGFRLALLGGGLRLDRLRHVGRLRQGRRLAPGRLRWNSAQSARRCNGAVRMQHVFGDIFRVGEVKVPRPCLAAHPALRSVSCRRELLQDQRDLRRLSDAPLDPRRRPTCGHETPRRPRCGGALRRPLPMRMCANDRLGVVLLAGGVPARSQVRAGRALLAARLRRGLLLLLLLLERGLWLERLLHQISRFC